VGESIRLGVRATLRRMGFPSVQTITAMIGLSNASNNTPAQNRSSLSAQWPFEME
jgi:hypothetical protein